MHINVHAQEENFLPGNSGCCCLICVSPFFQGGKLLWNSGAHRSRGQERCDSSAGAGGNLMYAV